MAEVSKSRALGLLNDLIQRGKDTSYASVQQWQPHAQMVFRNLFGGTSHYVVQLQDIRWHPAAISSERDNTLVFDRARQNGMDAAVAIIKAAITEVEQFWPDDLPSSTKQLSSQVPVSNRIFIVHGHDDAMKSEVARAVEQLELEPVILHEQSDQGKTIIEKFESNTDVGFAIILCSHDDMAYPKNDKKSLLPRPRQNVILELGYFFGKLGRERVFVLRREGAMELPSDISGIVYTPFDSHGGWKTKLMKELKAAGYSIDANNIL